MSSIDEKHDAGEKGHISTTPYSDPESGSPSIVGEDAAILQTKLGYVPEKDLSRNRSLSTLLFQSLAIAAIPFGEGSPLISAIYGGGNLSIFVGWIVVCCLDECVALSLAELASRWPTSAGPHYWSYQLAHKNKALWSYITGWIWLVGNWTITLSVNFGFASLINASITLYHPDFVAKPWQLLLIFYAICLGTFLICTFSNRYLPAADTGCAIFTIITIIVCLIALSVRAKAGRLSVAEALGHYDKSFSGYGSFTALIGFLPVAYTFSAIGMVTSLAEECRDAAIGLPKAISLCVPVGFVWGLMFILPICFTLPPLEDIISESGGQALPYIFKRVMGSPGGGFALTFLVLIVTACCSVSITVCASRCTWAFARDNAIPGSSLFKRIHPRLGVPVWSLVLTTIVQMLLGIINIGSTSAFTAFVSVGVIALALSYAVPIGLSMLNRRKEVSNARFHLPSSLGWTLNTITMLWILFELFLFSLPTALPVTAVSMNYASVVLVGFGVIGLAWYLVHSRHYYKGPPEAHF